MTMQIAVKLTDAGFTKIKTPFIMVNPGVWTKPKKVYVKTTPTGWSEVWPGIYYYTHTGTGYNLNMHAAFGYPADPATYIYTNNGTIASSDSGAPALVTGNFPAGSKVILVNNGWIVGCGGQGAVLDGNRNATPATAGGPALDAYVGLEVQNNGLIAGGGGGGGTGSSAQMKSGGNNYPWVNGGNGGNGAGFWTGRTGGAYGLRMANLSTSPNPPEDPANPIQDGVTDGASGAGGEGGDWGQPGRAGYPAWAWTLTGEVGMTGGASPGASVRYSGNVSFTVYGDIRGPLQ